MSSAVEASTVIVRVDVAEPPDGGVIEAGLKEAVAPVGRSVMARLTAELKPLREVIVIVDVPELPLDIVKDVGEALSEKSGAAVTCSAMSTVWLMLPLVPVTTNVEVPNAAEADTEIVRVEVAEPSEGGVTEAGLKEAVTSVGSPEIVRLTAELKPLTEVTVIVDVPELP